MLRTKQKSAAIKKLLNTPKLCVRIVDIINYLSFISALHLFCLFYLADFRMHKEHICMYNKFRLLLFLTN